MDYRGLKDKHLNVFCGYDKEYLENNITKAFINVLESLDEENQRRMFEEIFEIALPSGQLKAEFYLQRSPNKERFIRLEDSRKVLFAFSPSGKAYDAIEGVDENNEKAIYEAVCSDVRRSNPSLDKKEQDRLIADIIEDLDMRHNHDSVPDGWVLIHVDGNLEFVVAMENKRHDLNPYQLRNHLRNGLHCQETHPIVYASFSSIVGKLDSCKTFMADQFHEYLIILGYLSYKPSFAELCGLDSDLFPRFFPGAATPIVEAITGVCRAKEEKKDPRESLWRTRWNFQGARIYCNHSYLREINLCYENDDDHKESKNRRIYLSLALGPTMDSARELYNTLDVEEMKALSSNGHSKVYGPWCTLHCLYQRGKNNCYLGKYAPNDINSYVSFWCAHPDFLKLYNPPSDCVKAYEAMAEEGVIKKEAVDIVRGHFENKRNPVSIIPEIVFELSWQMDEIAEMKEDAKVIETMKAALKEFFVKAKLLGPDDDWPFKEMPQ